MDLTESDRVFLAERTMHIFAKGMQSGQSLASALAAIVARRRSLRPNRGPTTDTEVDTRDASARHV